MTWTFPPTGVTEETFASDDPTFSIPSSTSTVECPIATGFSECDVNSDFADTETFDVGALASTIADVYDWYTVQVEFFFPGLNGAHEAGGCVEQTEPEIDACGPFVDGASSGVGDWTPINRLTGVAESASGSATGPIGWSIGKDAGPPSAFVENPSPTAPIPDAYGNTAGDVFWTRAQVEALVLSVDWSGHYHDQTSAGNWLVSVRAWNGPIPRAANLMCVDW